MIEEWSRYLTPTATHRELGLVCLGAGRQRGFVPRSRRVLDCYAAVLVVDGKGWLKAGDPFQTYQLVAPALFWLFPGVPHAYSPDRHGWHELWTLFDGPAAGAYEKLGYLPRGQPLHQITDPAPTRRALERLLDICREEHPGVEIESAHEVHQVILAARHPHWAEADEDSAILRALREAASSPLPVAGHAHRLGLSFSTLRRIVLRSAGCAPKEYILRTRLNHAKTLLADTDLTIARIAKQVGYQDPAYFTRIFTRRTGTSPRTFRNQQRPDRADTT